jgi:hypothetical protein
MSWSSTVPNACDQHRFQVYYISSGLEHAGNSLSVSVFQNLLTKFIRDVSWDSARISASLNAPKKDAAHRRPREVRTNSLRRAKLQLLQPTPGVSGSLALPRDPAIRANFRAA